MELKYIELKTGYQNDDGPAYIAYVRPTKSGKGFYFNGQLFMRSNRPHHSNYYATDGNDYWVSGVKKQGDNRYPWGNQKIILQKSAVEDFLSLKKSDKIDTSVYEIVDFPSNFERKT